MAEFDIESTIKKGVDAAINKPVYGGKSITEWAAIGMKAPQWISVNDRLPEKNVPVLVWEKQGFAYIDRLEAECAWQIASTHHAIVTHWRPLPEPPEGVSGDD